MRKKVSQVSHMLQELTIACQKSVTPTAGRRKKECNARSYVRVRHVRNRWLRYHFPAVRPLSSVLHHPCARSKQETSASGIFERLAQGNTQRDTDVSWYTRSATQARTWRYRPEVNLWPLNWGFRFCLVTRTLYFSFSREKNTSFNEEDRERLAEEEPVL